MNNIVLVFRVNIGRFIFIYIILVLGFLFFFFGFRGYLVFIWFICMYLSRLNKYKVRKKLKRYIEVR